MRNIFIVNRDLVIFIKFCAVPFQSFFVGGREGGRKCVESLSILPLRTRIEFPGSSAGKVSACTAGEPGLIPGSGRHLE